MSDWSSDVCSSDLLALQITRRRVDSEASGDRGATEQHAETQAVARRQRDFRVPELVAERETGTDEGPELAMATGVGDPTRVDQFGLAPLLIRRGPYRPQHETHATVGQRLDRRCMQRRRRSEAHTSELQSLMRTSYDVFCLTQKNHHTHRILTPL